MPGTLSGQPAPEEEAPDPESEVWIGVSSVLLPLSTTLQFTQLMFDSFSTKEKEDKDGCHNCRNYVVKVMRYCS